MDEAVEAVSVGRNDPRRRAGTAGKHSKHLEVCLVGGAQIVRKGIELLLRDNGATVCETYEGPATLGGVLKADETWEAHAIVLIPESAGPFLTFRYIHNLLTKTRRAIPLVILADKASRGQVYTALRLGAKAYLTLDADPKELLQAIEMAVENRVYLAPDVAELLAEDISNTGASAGRARPGKSNLSPRELEILQLLCEGHVSKEVAQQLHISHKTVENHRYNIYRKCNVDNIALLVRHAIQNGMIPV